MEVTLEHIWPEWEIEGAIGSGGYGKVYKAIRRDTDAKAAIKIISIPENQSEIHRMADFGKSANEIKQILQTKADNVINEIRVMQRLKGANNIVAIEDSLMKEKNDGVGFDIFIRMELLIPLKTHFSRKHITAEDVIKLGCDVCSALEVCHKNMVEKKAIIHRDIKPDNILYHKISDSYKLGDFGISRELTTEDFDCTRGTGTANFMAPEVASFKEYDTRADLYSLGLVLYYLLNDQKMPFMSHDTIPTPGEAEIAMRKRISGAKLDPPLNSYSQLTAVILKACAFSPEERYSSATEMKKALQEVNAAEKVSGNTPEGVTAPSSVESVGKFGPKPKKHKGILIAGISALIILAIITSVKFVLSDFISVFYGDSLADGVLSGETVQGEMLNGDTVKDNVSDNSTQVDSEDDSDMPDGEKDKSATDDELFGTTTNNSDTESENSPIFLPNNSRNNAWMVEFNKKISDEFNDGESDWYKFKTNVDPTVYRIEAFSTYENSDYVYLRIALFDQKGIKIEEFTVHCRDEYDFIDLYLSPNTEYYIKVYGTDFGSTLKAGSYELCLTEMLCDAGTDKDSATELLIDTMNSAFIDSTLSDWHVFRAMKRGEYRITLHNIDVGCDIYMSVKHPGSAGEGISVANEDNYSWTISVNENDSVYFEVYSYNENPIANGQYIIEIEKEVK